MNFAVLAYNFPHWKTQSGIINLVMHGFIPDIVILQDKKELNIPQSKYRITPKDEYLLEPKQICEQIGLNYMVCDHNKYSNGFSIEFAVILGARILPFETIHQFPKGVLNIHPGILPGNRGLDNLKHSLVKGLPIGVTSHFIDARIDMGYIVQRDVIKVYEDDTIRDLYLRQRDLQIKVLIDTMQQFEECGINYSTYEKCEHSDKFGIVTEQEDNDLNYYLKRYGKHSLINN